MRNALSTRLSAPTRDVCDGSGFRAAKQLRVCVDPNAQMLQQFYLERSLLGLVTIRMLLWNRIVLVFHGEMKALSDLLTHLPKPIKEIK